MIIWKRILENKTILVTGSIFLLLIVAGILAPVLAPNDPLEAEMSLRYAGPSFQFPLGNDYLGRCLLSRMLYALRPSFLAILGVLAVTVFIGGVLGLVAGYFGGLADHLIMRACDVMLTLPSEVLTLAFVGLLGIGLKNILLAYVLLQWASFARLIRTSVMQYKSGNNVQFAKAVGFGSFYIMLRHVLPSALSEIIVITLSSVSSMILMVSGMSYLGLGVQAPSPELGTMLNEAKTVMFKYPIQILLPGLLIVMISLDCVFLSDSLRDALDPQYLKEERGIDG